MSGRRGNNSIIVVDEIVINRNLEDYEKRNSDERRRHIVYTAFLYLCFISVGVCSSIFNPTLVQLSTIFDTNLEKVSIIFPLRAFGCTVGTLTNGLLSVYFNRQILLISFLILKALTTFLVPHWTSVRQFYVNGFFNGFFTAAIVVIVNVWLNELWSWSAKRRKELRENGGETNGYSNGHVNEQSQEEDESKSSKIDIGNVLMQALHFFFGVGTILGPLLAEPFLRNPFSGMNGFFANSLVIPYAIASAMAVLSSLSFFVLFLICPYEQPDNSQLLDKNSDQDQDPLIINQDQDQEQDQNSGRVRNVSKHFRYLVIASASFFIFVFLCSEGVYFQFSASFATKTDLHLSEPNAALLVSALTVSFTVFRALSVLIALKLSPAMMILADLVMVTAGNTLVLLFANQNLWLFGSGFVLIGAGFASVFPSIFPFLERHGFVVTDWVGSLLTFSGGVSQILAPFLIGLYIDTQPFMLVYFVFGSVALALVALFTLKLFIVWSDRSRRQN